MSHLMTQEPNDIHSLLKIPPSGSVYHPSLLSLQIVSMSLPEKQILKTHDSTLPITHCSSVDPFQIRALNFNPEPWRSLTAYRRSDTEEEGNNPRDPQVGWNHRMVALGEPRLFKLRRGFKLILLSHFIFCRLPSYALHLAHTLEGVLPPNFGFRKVKKALKSCLKTKITIKIKRVETSMMNRSCSSFSLKSQSKDDSVSENAKGIRQAWSFNLQPIRLKLMVLQGEFAFWRELSLCPPSETARVVCILKN
nr:uncharacterized protein LOC111768565 isoform X2 [Equus caballus]